jgi:NADPH:quinone reductase-like Zn-dependent oxidoreductase
VARAVGERFAAGDYATIPHQVFPMGEIKEALEFMKTGKHVGKIVLSNYTKKADNTYEPLPVTVEKPQNVRIPSIVVYTVWFVLCACVEGDASDFHPPTHAPFHPSIHTRDAHTQPHQVFHADATYLVTGGAGGFGSALLRYAWLHGAKHFLITTRSADTEKVRSACASAANPNQISGRTHTRTHTHTHF